MAADFMNVQLLMKERFPGAIRMLEKIRKQFHPEG
jgi:hypothetical protein